ncbi:MAG: dihydroorotate dehydrogenase electron transfer subunit [Chloroflexia bacterium]
MPEAVLREKHLVMPATFLLRLDAPGLARTGRPGQFVMARCAEEGSTDPLLRRPLALHRFHREEGVVELLVRVVGRGTAWLAARAPGETLDLLGPLGRGFSLPTRARNVLLVAGGIGIAPLIAMADEALARGCAVVLALGARTAAELYPPALLPPEVELHLATEDGSAGRKATVVELLEDPEMGLLLWADQLMACGPRPMLIGLAAAVRAGRLRWRAGFAQVSLEERMACGVGACLGCVVPTRQGYRRVCHDGPVFDLKELVLEG